jgi:hypothetical protein
VVACVVVVFIMILMPFFEWVYEYYTQCDHDYKPMPGKPDDHDENYDWPEFCTKCGAKW